MSNQHPEHPVIKDIRELRGYDESVPSEEVYKRESIRMASWTPEQRAATLRDFDNRVSSYNENAGLRQKAQAMRFKSYLKTADARLKAAGR